MKKDWKKERHKAAKHARTIEREPALREALYGGGSAKDRRLLRDLDRMTAAPATGQRKET